MVSAGRRTHNRPKRKSTRNRGEASAALTADMSVADIIAICPGADDILLEYGISCAGCALGGMERLEEGCRFHGLSDTEIADPLRELNRVLTELPSLPQTLTITEGAARAFAKVMEEEGKVPSALLVTADGKGGFCMEFVDPPRRGHREFCHPEVSGVRVFASSLTLKRIGGSVIDFREGRFKLDLAQARCKDCEKDECDCGKNDVH